MTTETQMRLLKVGDNVGSRLVLAVKPVSDHPGDSYLQRVLCRYGDQYVVWSYNAQDGGFFSGRYCREDFEKASKIFLGQEKEKEELAAKVEDTAAKAIDVIRHAANVMSEAIPYCEHEGVKTKLRIWSGTLRDHLPETLEEEKKKQKTGHNDR